MAFLGPDKVNLVYVTKDITSLSRHVTSGVFVLRVSGAYFHSVYPQTVPCTEDDGTDLSLLII